MERNRSEAAAAEGWHSACYEGAQAAGDLDDLIFFGQEWSQSER